MPHDPSQHRTEQPHDGASLFGRIWPHVVAAGVAVHLIAVTLAAVPSPGEAVNRQAWSDPTVQAELAAWSQHVRRAGIDADAKRLEDWLWETTCIYNRSRQTMLTPFGHYYHYCGTRQSWCMFAGPNLHPTRIHIEIEEDSTWRPIYVARSSQHTWRCAMFSHDRFRAQLSRFGWGLYEWQYREFLAWLGREAARDFPDARRLRVRFFKETLRTPEEVRRGEPVEGHFVRQRTVDLS